MNTIQELWHSAQQLQGTDPNIIYKGKRQLDVNKDEKERQEVLNSIDKVVLSSMVKTLSQSHRVIIYYQIYNRKFVIKSIPSQLDTWNRLSPILTYGSFSNEEPSEQEQWIEEIAEQIIDFANVIKRPLSEETILELKKGLREVNKTLKQRKYLQRRLSNAGLLIAEIFLLILFPTVCGIINEKQIVQPLQQELKQQIVQVQNIKTETIKEKQLLQALQKQLNQQIAQSQNLQNETINEKQIFQTLQKQLNQQIAQTKNIQELQKMQETTLKLIQINIQKIVTFLTIVIAVNNFVVLILLNFPLTRFSKDIKIRNNLR